jgi:DNA (cytosine-5)-methyltransferase 1
MKNKIIDLFCGCGGLSRGFEMAGFDVEVAVDMWEDAIKTYNHNHKNPVAICKDIHNLNDEYLNEIVDRGEVVGVIGGPPCQGYSTVGTRDINDPRNHLYLEYCRIVEKVNPEFFVIENVKGLITLGGGAFKDDILSRFENLGYHVEYKILNAANYGIPQNRHRVFFVGMKKKGFEFPKEKNHIVSTSEALGDLPSLESQYESNEYISVPQNEYQSKMRENSKIVLNHEPTNHTEQTKEIIGMIKDGGKISDLPEEYWSVRKYNKAFQRMLSTGPSNTIDTGHRNYFHYKENRIPSVRESARIQSFPDDFEVLGSKTSQYKQIGNAVPPLLAYEIAKAIKDQL